MTQRINYNSYFLDLDNLYDEQEISRKIKDWSLGMYISLMNCILIPYNVILWNIIPFTTFFMNQTCYKCYNVYIVYFLIFYKSFSNL